jgi:hypothetical protein
MFLHKAIKRKGNERAHGSLSVLLQKNFEEMCLISGENSEITIADSDDCFGNMAWR